MNTTHMETSPIAFKAIELDAHVVTPSREKLLRAHIRKSAATSVVGLLGGLSVIAFMLLGPEVDGSAAMITTFLLVVSFCLLLGGILAIATPLIDLAITIRLKNGQNEIEALAEFEARDQIRKTFSDVLNRANAASVVKEEEERQFQDYFGGPVASP